MLHFCQDAADFLAYRFQDKMPSFWNEGAIWLEMHN